MTIIIVIFVVSLINKNNSTSNQALVNPPTVISPAPTRKLTSPTVMPTVMSIVTPTVMPTVTLTQTQLTPTVLLTIVPTEIILAQAPSSTPVLNPTNGQKITGVVPKVLPETGSWKKGFLIIGVGNFNYLLFFLVLIVHNRFFELAGNQYICVRFPCRR